MQFSAVEIRFIVTTLLYSTFTNDLKRKCFFFRKMFIVTEYAALRLEFRKFRILEISNFHPCICDAYHYHIGGPI